MASCRIRRTQMHVVCESTRHVDDVAGEIVIYKANAASNVA